MKQSIDLERLRITIERWEAAAEATDEHRKKLERLLPTASSVLRDMNNLTGCFQKPLEEATKEAITTYREILSRGAGSIANEAKSLTAISKRLQKESAAIEDAADRIRVFSVLSVGLSSVGIGLIAALIGFVLGTRQGYPFGYEKGFSEGTKTKEYQIKNDYLNEIGLSMYENKRSSKVLMVKPGYKVVAKQLEEGFFIRIYE